MEEIVKIKLDFGDVTSKLKNVDAQFQRIGDVATATFGATKSQLQAVAVAFGKLASTTLSPLAEQLRAINPLLKLQEVGWKGIGAAIVATPIGLLSKLFQLLLSAINPVLDRLGAFNPILVTTTALSKSFGDVASRVADVLSTLFTDPLEGIKQFGELIEEQVTNRINGIFEAGKALGSLFGSLFSGDFGKAKESLLSFGDAALKVVTGTEVSLRETAEALNTLSEAGDIDFSDAEAEIERLNEIIKDSTVSIKERIKVSEEAARKEKSLNAQKLGQLQSELNALKITGASQDEIFAKQKEINVFKNQAAAQDRARAKELFGLLEEEKKRIEGVKLTLKSVESIKTEADFNVRIGNLEQFEAQLLQLEKEFEKRQEEIRSIQLESGATPEELSQLEKRKQEAIDAVALEFSERRSRIVAEKQLADIEKTSEQELKVLKQKLLAGEIDEKAFADASVKLAVDTADRKLQIAKESGIEVLKFESELVDKQLQYTKLLKQEMIDSIEREKEERIALLRLREKDERRVALQTVRIELEAINKKLELAKEGTDEYKALLLKRAEMEKSLLDQTFSNTVNIAQNSLSKISEVFTQLSEHISQFTRQATEATISQIEMEAADAAKEIQKEVDAGVITQQEAAKRLEEIEREKNDKIRNERKKQVAIDKALAITQATINTAQAVLAAYLSGVATPLIGPATGAVYAAIAAAFGAAQIAAIAATPLPEFKHGVIDLQGPGTGTSDSIVARLSRGESVMTADETRSFLPTLLAIRNKDVNPDTLNRVATNPMDVKVIVNVDEGGFMVSEWKNGNRINYLDKRVLFTASY